MSEQQIIIRVSDDGARGLRIETNAYRDWGWEMYAKLLVFVIGQLCTRYKIPEQQMLDYIAAGIADPNRPKSSREQ